MNDEGPTDIEADGFEHTIPDWTATRMIVSPCSGICRREATIGLCVCCGRAGTEIGARTSLSPTARRAIIGQLPDRMAKARMRSAFSGKISDE